MEIFTPQNIAIESIQSEIEFYKQSLSVIDEEVARRTKENERRRFNLLPFALELIKALAQKGKLSDILKEESKLEHVKSNSSTQQPKNN